MVPKKTTILTPLQVTVLKALFKDKEFSKHFYLTGGTALAGFYLYHRYSDDLNFFTHAENMYFLWPLIQRTAALSPMKIETRTPNFIRIQVQGELQVDFVLDVPYRKGLPITKDKCRIDTLENIILNKISAIQGRLDPKDYVDLYFLLKDREKDILKLLAEAKAKDSSIEPFLWSKIIGDVTSFRTLPRMILPVDLKYVVTFFHRLRQIILLDFKP
ncbi:MAG: putative nucleotidyltransferase component of viral defense system [Candidatus Omnitrophota bacterium]|jgi:predicted nucleotidyltransferase component of viral defense system